MRKQGSILIEVMVSIMILSLTTTFIISTSMQNTDILKERILSERVNRDVCNLMHEFKYNMTRDEIEEMLKDGKAGFEYDGDFSRRLRDSEIKNLQVGEDIQVSKIDSDSVGLKIKIEANVKNEKSEVTIENEFTKSWWMDEI